MHQTGLKGQWRRTPLVLEGGLWSLAPELWDALMGARTNNTMPTRRKLTRMNKIGFSVTLSVARTTRMSVPITAADRTHPTSIRTLKAMTPNILRIVVKELNLSRNSITKPARRKSSEWICQNEWNSYWCNLSTTGDTRMKVKFIYLILLQVVWILPASEHWRQWKRAGKIKNWADITV